MSSPDFDEEEIEFPVTPVISPCSALCAAFSRVSPLLRTSADSHGPCVDEACTNIIRHAYHLRDDQFISLSLEMKSDCVCLRLRDYGKHSATPCAEESASRFDKPGGLGFAHHS
jgi:hypothetical protein